MASQGLFVIFLSLALSLGAFSATAGTPGTQKWAFTIGKGLYSSPEIGSDGTVYVGSDDGKLFAVKPYGTQKWAFTAGPRVYSSPAIGQDGTVYVGSYDFKLYAINSDSLGLANSKWPMFHQNSMHTGRWKPTITPIASLRLGD